MEVFQRFRPFEAVRPWFSAIFVVLLAASGCFDGVETEGATGGETVAFRNGEMGVVSGKVFGGNSPLAGARVDALVDGTSTTAETSITNAAGEYSLSLDGGTYDLRVTPPAGSGFEVETVDDVVVDGDTAVNILLVAQNQFHRVSGVVLDSAGNPLADIGITGSASTRTDENGRYEVTVAGSSAQLVVGASDGTHAPAVPHEFQCYFSVRTEGEENVEFDMVVPSARIAGQVRDKEGAPVGGVSINMTGEVEYQHSAPGHSVWCYARGNDQRSARSDDVTGAYAMTLFPGEANFRVQPPREFKALTFSTVLEHGDNEANVELERNVFSQVSGVVRDSAGNPLADIGITGSASTRTDENGRYVVTVAGTSAQLVVGASDGTHAPAVPHEFQCYFSVRTEGMEQVEFDMVVPSARIAGQVRDKEGAPVGGVSINMTGEVEYQHSAPGHSVWCYARGGDQRSARSDDVTGVYAMTLFPGEASFRVQPPREFKALTFSTVLEHGDNEADVELERNVFSQVSGVVRDSAGNPLADIGITGSASTRTDENGRYEVTVAGTSAQLVVGASDGTHAPAVPHEFQCYFGVRTEGIEHVEFDMVVPSARLVGTIRDSNGVPIGGASVRVNEDSEYEFREPGRSVWCSARRTDQRSARSDDATGAYAMTLFPSELDFRVNPPSGSGFSSASIRDVQLQTETALEVILQYQDFTAPVITSGPDVIHISDDTVSIQWRTNESADAFVNFGIGDLSESVESNIFGTEHAITLTGLVPNTFYNYQVGSSDELGNGPTTSDELIFQTLPPPGDITPPLIIEGPTAAAVTLDSAFIRWRTNEPATTHLAWGQTPSALSNVESGPDNQFRLEHGIQLSGLSPSTTYFVQVEAVDPDGNDPTLSAVIPFTTPDLPDTSPPIISGLEVVGVTHNQATVVWETDEPAIGGVSYNDGVRFFVVNDPTPRTHHSITLPELDALTGYFVTVSATDPIGNGPTLAGPVGFTTTDIPDTTPPTISDVVVECDTHTCTCSWQTDEIASASVSYGLVGSDLSHVVARTEFTAEHELPLSGLNPGSGYQLVIRCTDPSGNVTSSTPIDFQTEVDDTDGDGIPDDSDVCPLDADNDSDQDGICGDVDTCPTDPDNDADQDGACAEDDICPGGDDRVDSDGDLSPDHCDACPLDAANDADGDGICGNIDICPTDAANDADGDGLCAEDDVCPLDADNDADGDGICGDVDACPLDPVNDADGDGVCGNEDSCPGGDDTQDLDGDGTADFCDACPNDLFNDADGDGQCADVDPCPLDADDDADADGLCADVDVCPADPNNDQDGDMICGDVDVCPLDPANDADEDGVCGDVDMCPGGDDHTDSDGDGVPEFCDPCPLDPANDADGDGLCANVDSCPLDPDNDGDGDGLCADVDDCPADPNNDVDADGICGDVDACPNDPANDADNDGICGDHDQCPGGNDHDDQDGDGTADFCDLCPIDAHNDADGDGLCANVDVCPLDPANDGDGDGLCADVDDCPLDPANDIDQDGICGDVDGCPLDPANDADGDGVCGDVDICPGGDDHVDVDFDGTPDFCDVCPNDADNDIDGDGVCGDLDPCPIDNPDDTDLDGTCDSDDQCPADPGKTVPGDCGCGTPDSYPAWTLGQSYAAGERVTYQGVNYECALAHGSSHTGWNPAVERTLWNVVAPCTTDEWTEGVHYLVGTIVTYQGAQYRCLTSHVAYAGWNPAAVPALWSQL